MYIPIPLQELGFRVAEIPILEVEWVYTNNWKNSDSKLGMAPQMDFLNQNFQGQWSE